MASEPLIRFNCRCGHPFEVPQEMAAQTIQCPRCGLLRDIPTHADLENLDGDGMVKMRPAPKKQEPGRINVLKRTFDRRTIDDDGQEKDLRPTYEDLENVGVEPIPLQDEDTYKRVAPQYDPESGELIEPIEVAQTEGPLKGHDSGEPIPVAARALNYAAGGPGAMTLRRVLLELCLPVNIMVMFCMLILHVLLQATTFAWMGGFYFLAFVKVIFIILILSHYATTVEDVGPDEKDELPRPLRNVSLGEDLWRPFVHFAGALILCYWLPVVLLVYVPLNIGGRVVAASAAALVGTIFFPSIFLTLCTSGTLVNLRPDRVLAVIRAAGWRYIVAVFSWIVAVGVYLMALFSLVAQIVNLFQPAGSPVFAMGRWGIAYPLVFAAIFLMEFFCWQLGLIFRHGQMRFEWAFQRHVSDRVARDQAKIRAIREARKKQGERRIPPGHGANRRVEGS